MVKGQTLFKALFRGWVPDYMFVSTEILILIKIFIFMGRLYVSSGIR